MVFGTGSDSQRSTDFHERNLSRKITIFKLYSELIYIVLFEKMHYRTVFWTDCISAYTLRFCNVTASSGEKIESISIHVLFDVVHRSDRNPR